MASVAVTLDLAFRDNEHLRTENHRFANLINVVHAELQLLERMAEGDAGLRPIIRLCEIAAWSFKDAETARASANGLMAFGETVEGALSGFQAAPEYADDAEEAREITRQVLGEAHLRVQELLARHAISRPVETVSPTRLKAAVLEAAGDMAQSGRITVESGDSTDMPVGLPRALGKFAAELASTATDHVTVLAPDRSTVAVHTGPVDLTIVPDSPPAGYDPASPVERLRALVALLAYITGTNGTVLVDASGHPLLTLHMGS